ncbi:DUF1772 domain-containing protein [Paractinoplanes ferrugineus]|uniref:DUF1772 domain-containing protein n=1 Tax=Paractinoplanes ferrugineus TaxID=113564 RepID=A0A919MKX8_9ACTN|nr:anthrone oxygenase family protein [Actinoplanes ferrugineus]GIE16245.1 hypothetical protein Afe05nite_80850 [Actinoplanes ferrugineus]
MWLQVLAALFLLLAGLLAGVLFTVEMAIVPTIRALAADPWIRVHVLLDRRFDPMMPRMNKVALAIGLVLIVFVPGPATKVAFAAAALSIGGVAVISEVYNVRLNKRIAAWPVGDPPAEWPEVRARWARANQARTLVALGGFAVTIAAVALAWVGVR